MHSRLICTQWLHCLSTNIGILRQQPKQQHEIVEVGGLAGAAGHAASPRPAAPHSAIRPHALSVAAYFGATPRRRPPMAPQWLAFVRPNSQQRRR